MPKFFIGFGKCSKYLIFILGTVVFRTLNFFIFDDQIKQKNEKGIFGFSPILSNHRYIQNILKYISYIIGGSICECILSKKTKTKKRNDNDDNPEKEEKENIDRNSSNSMLIFNDQNEKLKINHLENFFVCSSFTISIEVTKILFIFQFNSIEFWTFEILYTYYFLDKNFTFNLYNYQKLAMFIIAVPTTILLIISSFLPSSKNEDKSLEKTVYDVINERTGSYWYIIPVEISFFISGVFSSFSRVKSKVLMDLRYLSPYLIIITIGIIGTILTFIILVVTSCFECSECDNNYICKVSYLDKNETCYLDNPLVYFHNLNIIDNEMYIEIFAIIPFLLIINFFEFLCHIFVIYYFNPYFILLRDNIYYFILRIEFVLANLEKFQEYMSLTQFIILELAEIFSISGFLIYLEIIELRFCGLDKHLKKNLLKKSEEEIRLSTDEKNNKLVNSMSTENENYGEENSEVNLGNSNES